MINFVYIALGVELNFQLLLVLIQRILIIIYIVYIIKMKVNQVWFVVKLIIIIVSIFLKR